MGKDFNHLLESIRETAGKIVKLNQQAVKQYTVVVDDIIRERCRDAARIEHTLDGLLDFCSHEPALQLFRHRALRPNFAVTSSFSQKYRHIYFLYPNGGCVDLA